MLAYESIVEGLSEAIAFSQSQDTGAKVHRIAVPQVDAAEVRSWTGPSQGAFAKKVRVE